MSQRTLGDRSASDGFDTCTVRSKRRTDGSVACVGSFRWVVLWVGLIVDNLSLNSVWMIRNNMAQVEKPDQRRVPDLFVRICMQRVKAWVPAINKRMRGFTRSGCKGTSLNRI